MGIRYWSLRLILTPASAILLDPDPGCDDDGNGDGGDVKVVWWYVASYTYVCTMHVKNGDKQTNGKLNSRSRIKEIGRTSKLTHTYQSVERNNQKPNSSLDITYQTDKFYWNKELWKEQPRSQQFESWEFLFHTVSLSQSLFTAYKDKPAFVIWISYHWKGRYHTTVQSNFHMEHLIGIFLKLSWVRKSCHQWINSAHFNRFYGAGKSNKQW